MSIAAILWFVLTNLPSIISLVKEIITLINMLPKAQQPQAMASFQTAVTAAKNGNAQPLKDLHQQLVTVGVGSAPVGNS
jgi:hypothetical protein